MRTLIIKLLIIFSFSSCITLKDTVVTQDDFLKEKKNPTKIYIKPGNGKFLNPFNINTDNHGIGYIERLMLAEFEPLEKYRSIELQIIHQNGKEGALVILYHAKQKQADVYHTPGLVLKAEMYENILNRSVITEIPFEYSFTENDGRLNVHLELIDRFNNKIYMHIDERNPEMIPARLLAPIGGESMDPQFMTVVFMNHFRFLSQMESHITVKINDMDASLLTLPLKVNGIKGFQVKYSMEPVTVSWNLEQDSKAEILAAKSNLVEKANTIIKLVGNENHPEIVSFSDIQNDHKVSFLFSPPIPDIQSLSPDVSMIGRFIMNIDDVQGIMAGIYSLETSKSETILTIQPTKGYSPVPGKAWMKKMTWEGIFTKTSGGDFHQTTKWSNK